MSDINQVILSGRLTRDPEVFKAGEATKVSFGLATNRRWKDQEYTTFTECVVWGKTGEFVKEYFEKGKPMWIVGRLDTRSWKGTDGRQQKKQEINVSSCGFMGPKDAQVAQPQRSQHAETAF